MNTITVNDGTTIYYKDWGQVSPSYSVTAGRSLRTTGTGRCSSSASVAIESSPMTGGGTAVPGNLGRQ